MPVDIGPSISDRLEQALESARIANLRRKRLVEHELVDGPHLPEHRRSRRSDDHVGTPPVVRHRLPAKKAGLFDAVDESSQACAAEGDLFGEGSAPQPMLGCATQCPEHVVPAQRGQARREERGVDPRRDPSMRVQECSPGVECLFVDARNDSRDRCVGTMCKYTYLMEE